MPMPVRTWKYLWLEADTRPLEFWLAGGGLVWGLWLLIRGNVYPLPTGLFWDIIRSTGNLQTWAAWSLFNFGFQLLSVFFKYPRFRKFSSCLAAVYWLAVTWGLFTIDPGMFIPWFTLGMGLGEVWVLFRRTAVGG